MAYANLDILPYMVYPPLGAYMHIYIHLKSVQCEVILKFSQFENFLKIFSKVAIDI